MIEGVDITRVIIAGFLAGYAMAMAGYWLEGVFGMPRIDLSIVGFKYYGPERPGQWVVGQIAHHVDSIGLAFIYAGAVFPNLGDLFDKPVEWWWGPIAGIAFGIVVFLVLAVGILGTVMQLAGTPMPMERKQFLANLGLHLAWGAILGALYFV